jgi:hypothetical protein
VARDLGEAHARALGYAPELMGEEGDIGARICLLARVVVESWWWVEGKERREGTCMMSTRQPIFITVVSI